MNRREIESLIARLEDDMRCSCYADRGEALWCDSCQAATALRFLLKEREGLTAALEPFSEFGSVSVDAESGAWASTIHREPVSTWFGPSDFRRARAAVLAPPQSQGDSTVEVNNER